MLNESAVYDAAHALYCLSYANVAEEHGESFSGCELTSTIEQLPNEKLAPIVWRIIGRIEHVMGFNLDVLFYHGEIESEHDQRHALTNLLLGCYGHGVSIADDHAQQWQQACERCHVQHRRIPLSVESIEFDELAREVYTAEHPEIN